MVPRRKTASLRTGETECKLRCAPPGGRARRALRLAAAAAAAAAGCTTAPPVRTIGLDELETASPVAATDFSRALVPDGPALRELCTPLGPRLGLLQIGSREQWLALARIVPRLGPCPNFSRGMIVGVACWAGLPADGRWPLRIEGIRVCRGGGLVSATFEPGTYLPDGTAYLETAYVDGLRTVLAVDINGTSFYPD